MFECLSCCFGKFRPQKNSVADQSNLQPYPENSPPLFINDHSCIGRQTPHNVIIAAELAGGIPSNLAVQNAAMPIFTGAASPPHPAAFNLNGASSSPSINPLSACPSQHTLIADIGLLSSFQLSRQTSHSFSLKTEDPASQYTSALDISFGLRSPVASINGVQVLNREIALTTRVFSSSAPADAPNQ